MDSIKSVLKFILKYPLAIAGTFLLIVIGIMSIIFKQKIQLGGILGWLWRTKIETDPNIRVIPPVNRKDDNGNVIQPGQPDENGYVQIPDQIVIKEPGILSDPTKIVINHPVKGEVVIPLPTGVRNTDVSQIIEISPNVYQIKNNDKPSVNVNDLLNSLEDKQ